MSRSLIIIILFILFLILSCDIPTDGIQIYSITATPTESEQVTIINTYTYSCDVSDWTIGDKNDPTAYNIPNETILSSNEKKTFSHTTLNFGINDSDEIIYLKDGNGKNRDTWSN